MNPTHFIVHVEHKIAQVSFNRPEKSNALHMDAWIEMKEIFDTLSSTPEVRVIILFGEGKHFCSGIDLELLRSIKQFKDIPSSEERAEKIKDLILTLQEAVTSIEKCSKPVIASVDNGCIGGGVDIISACDLRYCTKDAYFTIKEIDLGMVADLGTLQRLPKVISSGVVAEMAYTGRNVFGDEANTIGLVNECFESKEDLTKGVDKIAKTIARKSPLSIRGIKEVLRYSREHSVKDSLNHVADWNSIALQSNDLTEAISAFMEKRDPNFED
jgi:enoyl-CoA hydratase